MSATLFWRLGAVLGASGVALGAFGAHGLKSMLAGHPDAQRKQENWATAAHYQLIHAAALLALSTRMQSLGLPRLQPSRAAMAGWLLVAGVAGFSGSIYLLVLDTRRAFSRFLGPVTPLGGVCFIAGPSPLLSVLALILRNRSRKTPVTLGYHRPHPHHQPPSPSRLTMSASMFWKLGAGLGASGVVLSAFGAHGLRPMLKGQADTQSKQVRWSTAAYYQLVHAAALLALSARMQAGALVAPRAALAGWLFVAGIAGFSGTIYINVFNKNRLITRIIHIITPQGGMCLIAGWLLLAFS
ncbi:hypothetical protein HK105_201561 [Polyrhizophydium stewartii]|uniref:DUF423-domain-containing protein n=1 Tax=Polyrhizophydium stewartii TaxID=2732419 RepID=A0ABR4NGR2_9FUNG